MVEPAYGRAWAIEHSLKRWQHQYPIVNPSIHPSNLVHVFRNNQEYDNGLMATYCSLSVNMSFCLSSS